MAKFELYVHGVPVGHEIYGSGENREYVKRFYTNDDGGNRVSAYMQVEVENGVTYHTYLHKRNVSNADGRPGSYLGLTLGFSGECCTNTYTLYDLLDSVYNKVCVGSIIKQVSDGELFLAKDLDSVSINGHKAFDFIEGTVAQLLRQHLDGSFAPLPNSAKAAKKVAYFNLMEVDSPLFREMLGANVLRISPDYEKSWESVAAFQNKSQQLESQNGRLKSEYDGLSAQKAQLEKDLANATALSAQKNKNLQKEAQEKDSEIARLQSQLKQAEAKLEELSELPKKITNLLKGQQSPKRTDEFTAEPTKKANTKLGGLAKIFPFLNTCLLVCVLAVCALIFLKPADDAPKPTAALVQTSKTMPYPIDDEHYYIDVDKITEGKLKKGTDCKMTIALKSGFGGQQTSWKAALPDSVVDLGNGFKVSKKEGSQYVISYDTNSGEGGHLKREVEIVKK